jgi:REP element-mobilizing transposase RayT
MSVMSRKELSDIDAHQFRAIDPWKSEGLVITRRNLPHLEVPGATYFVTFRCAVKVSLSPEERDLIMAVLQACDQKIIDLEAAVVMPNHVHAIFRIFGSNNLSRVLQRIKGRSARQLNRAMRRTGSVWIEESFDHIIRDETELSEKIEYIRNNPARSGLEDRSGEYRWLYVRNNTA